MTTTPPPQPGPTLDPDLLTLDAIRAGALAGRPVSVLGFARSGIALARFLVDAGATVTVYDWRPAEELVEALARLDGRPIRLLAGPQVEPSEALAGAALVATSPSVNPDYPTTEPRLRAALAALVAARAAGDPNAPAIVSEPDLVLRLCPAPTVGISGTKGKTTTSALAHALLAADPRHRAILGGNIGRPLVERLAELRPDDRVVIELSELQLPTLSRGTTVAVLTNVTSDHLDRHGTLEAYRAVKRRFAQTVDPAGALVLNLDDPVVAGYAELGSARVVGYRLGPPAAGGVGLADGWIVADGIERLDLAGGGRAATGPGGRIAPIHELTLPGRHNLSNTLAAMAVALLFGVPPEAIRSAAAAFVGVEHRLETVAVVDGIRFVNDSQGTQPDAVVAALRAFDPPIVLIAGGRDKGIDLGDLGPVVAERVVAAILIGESGPDLERRFRAAGLARTEQAATLEAAVARAATIAAELRGGRIPTVLLSPAAASFDMFADYEARGQAFKAAVARLAEEGSR
ncbi:MAG: UDP-N-acetylmuramoyl-L-alanine--D-glutamate ligase [Chloroflexota bacterium]|nr:UDP-N-acetylmuramoyl-L-alanine--D-glutamate ligase [Chloroflexota bacterium]